MKIFDIWRRATIKTTYPDVVELIGGYTEERDSDVVEAGKPDLASMITNGHRNDVPGTENPSHHGIEQNQRRMY
jgi:hypothetical protein